MRQPHAIPIVRAAASEAPKQSLAAALASALRSAAIGDEMPWRSPKQKLLGHRRGARELTEVDACERG